MSSSLAALVGLLFAQSLIAGTVRISDEPGVGGVQQQDLLLLDTWNGDSPATWTTHKISFANFLTGFNTLYQTANFTWTNFQVSSNFVVLAPGGYISNQNWTAKTVLEADANKTANSIPNGTGFLLDDGSGNFSWSLDGSLFQNISNVIIIRGNKITVTNVTILVPGTFINSNLVASALVATDPILNQTNIPNAAGVLTNGTSGPPSYTMTPTLTALNLSGNGTTANFGSNFVDFKYGAGQGVLKNSLGNLFLSGAGGITMFASSGDWLAETLDGDGILRLSDTTGNLTLSGAGIYVGNGGGLTNLNYGALTGGVSFVQIDASALWTNGTRTPSALAAVTPGSTRTSLQGSGPAFPALWPVSTTGSNDFYFQFYPPPGYQGTFTVSGEFLSATNSTSALPIVASAALSGAGSALGTAVTVTNAMAASTGFISTNIACSTITCSGSPVANTPIVGLFQTWGGQAGFLATNNLYLQGLRVSWTNSTTQNALLTGW